MALTLGKSRSREPSFRNRACRSTVSASAGITRRARRNSMALGLTPEHLELAAAVRGWSQRHCPADAVRAAADGEDSGAARYRAELAPSLAGQGLLGLHLPEDAGGQGYGLPELAVALEETGRALLPGAFLPTVLASAVLAEMETGQPPSVGGPAAKLIARLADGSLAGAVCLATGLTGIRGADGGLTVSGGCSACRATPSRPPSPSPSGRREIDASRASQSGSYRPCAAGAANLSWRACIGG